MFIHVTHEFKGYRNILIKCCPHCYIMNDTLLTVKGLGSYSYKERGVG